MNKISIKLQGGVGNYMFQIAAAYAYAKRTNKECIFTTGDAIKVHQHIDTYKDNILKAINFKNNFNFSNFKVFNEPWFHYTEIPNINSNVYIQGYFQSEKYFKEYRDEIREMFSMPLKDITNLKRNIVEKYGKEIVNKETCSIHVRRGDYLNSPNHHPQQGIQYYMKAAKKIGMDKIFLIFSDDIQWCKENFPEVDNFKFIEGYKDYEDLTLMSMCNHNIICNSTFSWWAAWLNASLSKRVIIPKNWFGSAYSNYNTDDIYCEGWEKI